VNHAVKSEDTYVPDVDAALLRYVKCLSHCEIELFLDDWVVLIAVISACYTMSKDICRISSKWDF
jgi:hypothetical protein